jgi:hypothetical protein
LAIALRQGLGASVSVVVADPALAGARGDARATAIVAATPPRSVRRDTRVSPVASMFRNGSPFSLPVKIA